LPYTHPDHDLIPLSTALSSGILNSARPHCNPIRRCPRGGFFVQDRAGMDPEETSPGNVLMIGLQQRTNGIKGNATEGR